MAKHEDVVLYERACEGNKQALERIYDKYSKLLFSFSLKMVGNKEEAEEIVQEVMIKLWRKKGAYSSAQGSFSSWILTVTRNTAIDYLRKLKKTKDEDDVAEVDLSDPQQSVPQQVEWREKQEKIRTALKKLKQEQQDIVQLFYFKGLSQQQIAERTKLPLGTVKSRLRLALKHLRSELADEGRELG